MRLRQILRLEQEEGGEFKHLIQREEEEQRKWRGEGKEQLETTVSVKYQMLMRCAMDCPFRKVISRLRYPSCLFPTKNAPVHCVSDGKAFPKDCPWEAGAMLLYKKGLVDSVKAEISEEDREEAAGEQGSSGHRDG